jgi:hypothetical protein
MKLKDKIKDQYIFSNERGNWTFCDENNRPIGIEYDTIEKAVDALLQYLELEESTIEKNHV